MGKTIKQLAEEIGVSKQRGQNDVLPSEVTEKHCFTRIYLLAVRG